VPSARHNHERIGRLDEALSARGVRDIGIVTKCSPPDAERGILERLVSMGLLRLFMGIESGSSCGLASIGRRQTVEDSERALALCEDLGLSTQYTMIIFSPEATAASMLADLDFVARHPAHPLNYCRAEIYSGTPLEARMLAEGRAEGSYLGRTYRYADPAVALVWEVGKDLFAGRCWGKDDLLGSVIRLDHQVAVLRHFYEGARVREVCRTFGDWQVELNLETAGLFRELVVACADAAGPQDVPLRRAVDRLRRAEEPLREARLARLCKFRTALERYANASVTLGRRHARAKARGRRSLAGPRHAAAVAAAIGMLGCAIAQERGVQEAAPPPVDRRPPPLEGPQRYRYDGGVAEAAPPPIDRYRYDGGVAEAAPPPLKPPVVSGLAISTEPSVPLTSAGQRVPTPFVVRLGGPSVLVGGEGTAWSVRLSVSQRAGNGVVLRVESERPLNVQYGGTEYATPARIVYTPGAAAGVLVLHDPETKARLRVKLAPR
jgi:hypothetical protein